MAIFGVQLGLTMIVVSLISKLGSRNSLARWLLCNTGLVRYLHPSDKELRDLAGIPKDIFGKGKSKGRNSAKDAKNPDVFHVPKNLDIQLDSVKVTAIEVINLKFYEEYHWVVDFFVYSVIVYVLTEIYYCLFNPSSEMNLSIYWSLLSLGMCIKVMASITSLYFKGDEVMGERAMVLVMGLVYLLVAMIILIVDENNLELGVDSAYKSFYENALQFMEKQGVEHVGPASKLIIKFVIAVCCAVLGTFCTFPGIRLSRMFFDSLNYYNEHKVIMALLYFTYGLPVFLAMLWVKPFGRYFFTQAIIGSQGEALMSDTTFESFRLLLILLLVLSRFCLMPYFLQSFLSTAQTKLYDMKKEAGRILNTDLQKQVAGIYYFLCIVALQYVTPCIICLNCCFLYKTLGDQRWAGSYGDCWALLQRNDTSRTQQQLNAFELFLPGNNTFKPTAEQVTLALSSLKMVFNDTVFKGIFGFATWWTLFLFVATSAVGSLYMTYFRRA